MVKNEGDEWVVGVFVLFCMILDENEVLRLFSMIFEVIELFLYEEVVGLIKVVFDIVGKYFIID